MSPTLSILVKYIKMDNSKRYIDMPFNVEEFCREVDQKHDLLMADAKELLETLKEIQSGQVYRDGKKGKTPKTRSAEAITKFKAKHGDL